MLADTILSGCLFAGMALAVGVCLCAAYMFLKEKEIFPGTAFAGMGMILLMLIIGLVVLFIERGP